MNRGDRLHEDFGFQDPDGLWWMRVRKAVLSLFERGAPSGSVAGSIRVKTTDQNCSGLQEERQEYSNDAK